MRLSKTASESLQSVVYCYFLFEHILYLHLVLLPAGCAKVLQFCNIFIRDASDITRYQKNEIIKYVRTRIPIFMSQIHQLLRNILNVFTSLSAEEKAELVNYLVPEVSFQSRPGNYRVYI